MYKSKLLNFFIQQLQRLGEKSERALRHLKLATLWSIQLLLYPIYNFLQSTKKQLKPPVTPRRLLQKTGLTISHSENPVKEKGGTSDWLPIQIFFNFVTWVQIVPIALTFNLFSEKAFALSPNPPLPAAILRNLLQQVQNLGIALVSDAPGTTLPVNRETDPFGIQSLFKAAIDYFFAKEKTPAIMPVDEEPGSVALVLVPPFSSLPANPANTEERSLQQLAHMPQIREVEYTPDWIETTAYSVGYVKHPLEVVLEWLDKALLWLEKLVVACLCWLKLVLNF